VFILRMLGKKDIVFSDCSKLTFVLDIQNPSVIDVVPVGDEGSFHRFTSFKVNSMASFDNVLETVSKSVSKTI